MAEKEKNYMPQSTAGLIRYFDVQDSRVKLKPEHIVVISAIFGGLVLLLKILA